MMEAQKLVHKKNDECCQINLRVSNSSNRFECVRELNAKASTKRFRQRKQPKNHSLHSQNICGKLALNFCVAESN